MSGRLPILKTFKLYVGGAFPRTESGRTTVVEDASGRPCAHLCRASRKDFRNAVTAARKAADGWARRDAYNRGQILYRMAEMLEGRAGEFGDALAATVPGGAERARCEVEAAVDRLVAFAGWADKFAQVLGNQNPVAGPYHNFSLPEPCGVVAVVAPDEQPLLGLVGLLAPALCGGNAVVALASAKHPLAGAVFGEVCATSDVPAGVVNLLTGRREELLEHVASHRDVDAVLAAGCTADERRTLELGAAENLKRVHVHELVGEAWYDATRCASPDWIEGTVDIKTLWHPSAS